MILVNKTRRKPRIDMVPLIDVLMVLIIFFLVTMQFKDLRALNVKLPKIETAGSNLIKNELIISVSKNGLYTVDSQKVSIDKLQKIFSSASLLQKKPTVLVVADEDSALKHVTEVVDLCRKNGLEDFRLQAR
ncbi:MAG: biopolymer transporter TolR [Opitutae bacterium]|nr:biopolymer transporter TolR [Opitutae bacterium]